MTKNNSPIKRMASLAGAMVMMSGMNLEPLPDYREDYRGNGKKKTGALKAKRAKKKGKRK